MKLVRASQAKGPANRAEAWACVTANLALPGSGSLAAGKSIGYFQLALATVGFIISTIAGIHLLQFITANWTRIMNGTGDPFENLILLWGAIRWPLVGLGVFGLALIWSGITSMQLLAAHPKV